MKKQEVAQLNIETAPGSTCGVDCMTSSLPCNNPATGSCHAQSGCAVWTSSLLHTKDIGVYAELAVGAALLVKGEEIIHPIHSNPVSHTGPGF